METRASPFIIGLFTLGILGGVLAFVFWIGRYADTAGRDTYRIVFSDEVTGLNRGSSVLFNGIRVGDVVDLSLAEDDPSQVVALVQIDSNIPVRVDTRAQLQYQGITGIGYIQLQAGRRDAIDLRQVWEDVAEPPIIYADRSTFQDLMEGAQSVLTSLDDIAARFDSMMVANESAISNTVRNIEQFSGALAENSDAVSGLLADVGSAAQRLDQVGVQVEDLAGNLNQLIVAVEPDEVRGIVTDLRGFTDTLSASEAAVATIIGNVETFSTALADNSDAVASFLADAGTAAQRLDRVGADIEALTGDLRGVVAAIEPEEVRGLMGDLRGFADTLSANQASVNTIIGNVETFSTTLANNSDAVETLMADAGAAVQRFEQAGMQFETLAGNVNRLVEGVEPDAVSNLLADAGAAAERFERASAEFEGLSGELRSVVAAVEPEEVRGIVGDIRSFADTLSANEAALAAIIGNTETFTAALADNSDAMTTFLADASSAAHRLNEVGGRLESMTDSLGEVVAAVEPDEVRGIVADVRVFTTALNENSARLGAFAEDAGSAAQRIDRLVAGLDGVGDNLNRIVTAVDADAIARTVANVESFSDTLAGRSGDLDQFLDDAGAIAAQFRQTAQRLDALLVRVDGMVGEDGEGFMGEIAAAARSVRQLTENLDTRLDVIAADVERFGGGGLREFQALMGEGRRTVANLERVINSLERNPTGFLFGGSQVPEYNPGRRF